MEKKGVKDRLEECPKEKRKKKAFFKITLGLTALWSSKKKDNEIMKWLEG